MLGRGLGEVAHFVVNVWTGGRGGEESRGATFGFRAWVKTQGGDDVFSHARCCSGCERNDRDTRED